MSESTDVGNFEQEPSCGTSQVQPEACRSPLTQTQTCAMLTQVPRPNNVVITSDIVICAGNTEELISTAAPALDDNDPLFISTPMATQSESLTKHFIEEFARDDYAPKRQRFSNDGSQLSALNSSITQRRSLNSLRSLLSIPAPMTQSRDSPENQHSQTSTSCLFSSTTYSQDLSTRRSTPLAFPRSQRVIQTLDTDTTCYSIMTPTPPVNLKLGDDRKLDFGALPAAAATSLADDNEWLPHNSNNSNSVINETENALLSFTARFNDAVRANNVTPNSARPAHSNSSAKFRLKNSTSQLTDLDFPLNISPPKLSLPTSMSFTMPHLKQSPHSTIDEFSGNALPWAFPASNWHQQLPPMPNDIFDAALHGYDDTKMDALDIPHDGNQHIFCAPTMYRPPLRADLTAIPTSVSTLHALICDKNSDYAFVYSLCAQLCQTLVPMGSYVYFKMALLLSLASLGPRATCPPISLIAIAGDAYMANKLMSSVGNLAPRFVAVSDFKASSALIHNTCHPLFEANPIMLARGGVYYAGNWRCLKKPVSDVCTKAVENAVVFLSTSTAEDQPLESAIWSYWHPESGKEMEQLQTFFKVFGLPVYMSTEVDDVLLDFILQQYSSNTYAPSADQLSIPEADMRIFIGAIAKREVDFTKSATELLQAYFVTKRAERPCAFTKQSYAVLRQYAESFARLAMRLTVLDIDVVAAIFICEYFMHNILGRNRTASVPKFKTFNRVSKIDDYMSSFHQWLNGYIGANKTKE